MTRERHTSTSFCKQLLIILLIIVGNLIFSQAYASRVIESTGSAYINNGAQHLAKENAIKNAMQQALLQNKAHIDSYSSTNASILVIDSARVNTSGTVEDVKVLDEWVKDEIYFVRIRANIPDSNDTEKPKSLRYRKKVAAIQFDVLHRRQIYDLKNIEFELPREILRRMDNTGDYISVDATQYLVSDTHPGLVFDNPGAYKMIGDKTGAQIIISGQIRDMQVIENFFGDKRRLEIEIYVHDGISGARLARHRFSETVTDASYIQEDEALFSSAGFNKTNYGRALNHIIDSQIELVTADINQIPFSAKIIKVDGTQIYFDAGASSLIHSGDMLMTYKLEPEALRAMNDKFLGHMETPVASLAVQQVQPQFSIGKLEIKNPDLTPGDIVRFGR